MWTCTFCQNELKTTTTTTTTTTISVAILAECSDGARDPLLVRCSFMDESSGRHSERGAAWRRRQRRLRSCWRHEQQTAAAVLATFQHHFAPRGQRAARTGGGYEVEYTAALRLNPPLKAAGAPYFNLDDGEDAPAAGRPAPLLEVRPQAGSGRHTEVGSEHVLDPVLPPLGAQVADLRLPAFLLGVDEEEKAAEERREREKAAEEERMLSSRIPVTAAQMAALLWLAGLPPLSFSSSWRKGKKKRKRRKKKLPKACFSSCPLRLHGDLWEGRRFGKRTRSR